MNNILKSICLLGLLAGSTLALTPEEKLGKMNAAFAEGNTAAAEKWGLEMLHDGDMTSGIARFTPPSPTSAGKPPATKSEVTTSSGFHQTFVELMSSNPQKCYCILKKLDI